MGCKQSKIVPYAIITDEDRKVIPSLYREVNKSHKSPGIEYWKSTCLVKEGKVPIKIGSSTYELEYVCVKKDGYYPDEPGRVAQDSFLFCKSSFNLGEKEDNGIFAGVFDGHGEFGAECSIFCRDFIEKKVTETATISSVDSYLIESLESCNAELHDKKYSGGVDDTNSGTTAVCLSIINNTITCVNVGDSRCVAGFVAPSGEIVPIPLSYEHNPVRKDERKRLEECGAEVFTITQRRRSNDMLLRDHSSEYNPADPPRVYMRNKPFPGAAFSRSIGDCLAETIGVVATGEAIVKQVARGLNHIVIASDGLWNYFTPQEMTFTFKYATDLAKTSVNVVLTTFLRWLNSCSSSDDITMIVLRFPSLPEEFDNVKDWNPEEYTEKDTMVFSSMN